MMGVRRRLLCGSSLALQFYLDFVESENSNGFHAPQEAVRILGTAIDHFRQGQVSLRPLKVAAAPSSPVAGAR